MFNDTFEARQEYAMQLAHRAMHLAATTMLATKRWSDTTYVIQTIGRNRAMLRIPYLDRSEEFIFDTSTRAVCWVDLNDDAIIVDSYDDYNHIIMKMNYKKHNKHTILGPIHTADGKQRIDSPTSVIPDTNNLPVKPFDTIPKPKVFRAKLR